MTDCMAMSWYQCKEKRSYSFKVWSMLVIIKSFKMKTKVKREKMMQLEFRSFFLLSYFCSIISRKREQSFMVQLVCYYCPLCFGQYAPNVFFFNFFFFLYRKTWSRMKIFLKLHQIEIGTSFCTLDQNDHNITTFTTHI